MRPTLALAGVALASATLLAPAAAPSAPPGEIWARLAGGGHVVVIRHATAPGVGDPAGFRLEDCATQRNLSEAGRDEARRLGEAFRARRVPVSRVLSSRWCRCLETARLAFGRVEPWAALDSFFADRGREAGQTKEARRLAGERPASGNVVFVTHQVNINALTGLRPVSGEMIVLDPRGEGRFEVVGRLAPSDID